MRSKKTILFFLSLVAAANYLSAQDPARYKITADSVYITNDCNTAELILENHTQNVNGFLFNKGRGRTEFRKGLVSLSDTTYLIGTDTLDIAKAVNKLENLPFFKQGGNNFNTTAILGTKQNHALTFIQKNAERGRIDASGNWLFGTTTSNGRLAQFNGTIWSRDTIYQDKNVHIVSTGGEWGDAKVNIGQLNHVTGNAAIAIGQNVTVNSVGGVLAFGVGKDNYVKDGIGIFGGTEGGIALGMHTFAYPYAIALGPRSVTNAVGQFVCGGPDFPDHSTEVNDVYFGSGVQRSGVTGAGRSYTINGAGAFGGNYGGGNLTLAGGKGTGTGTPGAIIFAIAAQTSAGTNLQQLTESARFAPNSGNLLLNTTSDENNCKLNVNGSARFHTYAMVTAPDEYDIRFNAHHGNGFAPGIDASRITFGNIIASIGVNKQNFGYIPKGSLIIGGSSPGTLTTIVDYRGNPTFVTMGNGQVGINGGFNGITNAGQDGFVANANAFSLSITGGVGTGTGSTGDIVFATGNSQPSGTVVHATSARWYIKGNTGHLSNTPNPTSAIDVESTSGYSQLRLRQKYTPSSSADPNGNVES